MFGRRRGATHAPGPILQSWKAIGSTTTGTTIETLAKSYLNDAPISPVSRFHHKCLWHVIGGHLAFPGESGADTKGSTSYGFNPIGIGANGTPTVATTAGTGVITVTTGAVSGNDTSLYTPISAQYEAANTVLTLYAKISLGDVDQQASYVGFSNGLNPVDSAAVINTNEGFYFFIPDQTGTVTNITTITVAGQKDATTDSVAVTVPAIAQGTTPNIELAMRVYNKSYINYWIKSGSNTTSGTLATPNVAALSVDSLRLVLATETSNANAEDMYIDTAWISQTPIA